MKFDLCDCYLEGQLCEKCLNIFQETIALNRSIEIMNAFDKRNKRRRYTVSHILK
jgi:hypothetical protein